MRRAKARTVEALIAAIKEALDTVTAADIRGWFEYVSIPYTDMKTALDKGPEGERQMEWYWDPYWLYTYWKSHLIVTGLTVVLVLACVGVSILVIRRRIAKIVQGRRPPPHP